MKKAVLFVLACIVMCLSGVAQKKTFKAACLNVDGMPPSAKILGGVEIKLNPDGAREVGSRRIGELVAQKGWDFVGLSEDFNYHTELMEHLKDHYYDGTHRGSINTNNALDGAKMHNGKLKLDTDGLGFLWKKSVTASGEAWTAWNTTHGYTDSGSDELIMKGYRYYMVSLGSGLEVDVYAHHMDAETNPEDNAARESQINQLVEAILASDNHRPIIILGDTNCRYTRDNLKGLLFERINADPRFTIHDPWVDFQWDGVMPELGTNALMVSDPNLGQQKGEVVDKIFYIDNNDANGVRLTANSYLHDTDFSYADGTPISDHYPIVIEFTIENTLPLSVGADYYIRNVGTGKYIHAGGHWGTQAILDTTGGRFTLGKGSSDTDFTVQSSLRKDGCEGYIKVEETGNYLDGNTDQLISKGGTARLNWTINQLEGGVFSITDPTDGRAMAASSDGTAVCMAAADTNDPNQQWELLTFDDLRNELLVKASDSNPMDATFFIKGAGFDPHDSDNDEWSVTDKGGASGLKYNVEGMPYDTSTGTPFYSMFVIGGVKAGLISSKHNNATATQMLKNLPNGKYGLSFNFVSSTNNGHVYVGGKSFTNTDASYDGADVNVVEIGGKFANGDYRITYTDDNGNAYLNITTGELELKLNKENNSSKQTAYFDNFRLIYYGLADEEKATYDNVKRAIDDAQAKAEAMGLSNYDNSTVIELYEERRIVGNGDDEIEKTYTALASAAKSQKKLPADMRYVCMNNSFELYSTRFWDATAATDPQVVASADVANADGEYVYSAGGGTISQKISLPAGIYSFTVMLSSGARFTVGDVTKQAVEPVSSVMMRAAAVETKLIPVEVRVKLPAQETTVSIASDTPFVADDLRIERIGDETTAEAYPMLEAAISDADARVAALGEKDPGLAAGWSLDEYRNKLANYEVTGTGHAEFYDIYDMLRERVARQVGENIDMTSAIINPSFELGKQWGEPWGWYYSALNDTKVARSIEDDGNLNGTYGVEYPGYPDNVDPSYGIWLFNTWDNGVGYPVTQTIDGMPAGSYRLDAMVASDAGKTIFLTVNGVRVPAVIPAGKNTTYAQPVSAEFDLAKGENINIEVTGGDADGNYVAQGGTWYKTDNFRLTLLKPESDVSTGVETVSRDFEAGELVDVYSTSGVGVIKQVRRADLPSLLPRGIYILRSASRVLKLAL